MDTVQFDNAKFLLEKIQESDAVLVGAAAGFSAADGKHFWYEADKEFQETFRPFIEKYGIQSAFDGYYYPFKTPEEHWGYLATLLHHMYESKAGQVYKDLKTLLQNKPYHIMTTNQDFLFFQDFPENKVSVIQGDQRWFQRADGGIKDRLFENKDMVYKMFDSLKGGKTAIPTELIPRDPEDGTELMPWVRHPGFLEKSKYQEQYAMIRSFLDRYKY